MDPNANVTVGQVVAYLKDLIFLVGIPVIGWKARGLIQPVIDFFNDAKLFMTETRKHMANMDNNMTLMMGNHLPHIESDLKTLSGRKNDIIEIDDTIGSM